MKKIMKKNNAPNFWHIRNVYETRNTVNGNVFRSGDAFHHWEQQRNVNLLLVLIKRNVMCICHRNLSVNENYKAPRYFRNLTNAFRSKHAYKFVRETRLKTNSKFGNNMQSWNECSDYDSASVPEISEDSSRRVPKWSWRKYSTDDPYSNPLRSYTTGERKVDDDPTRRRRDSQSRPEEIYSSVSRYDYRS